MDIHELSEQLREGVPVVIAERDWLAVAAAFPVRERHDTHLAGELLIVDTPAGLAAVEQPDSSQRVIRHLADEVAVRAFVHDRLDTYDRMWDGCGCRVDYYA